MKARIGQIVRSRMVLAYGLRVCGAFVLYLMNVVLARVLGAVDYGAIAFAFNWLGLAMLLGPLGFNTASLRYVAAYLETESYWDLRRYLVFALSYGLLGSFLAMSVIWAAGTFLPAEWLAPNLARALIVVLPLAAILPMLDLLAGVQRGHGAIVSALAPYALVYPVVATALVLIVSASHPLELVGAGRVLTVAAGTALIFACIALLGKSRLWWRATKTENQTTDASPTRASWLATAVRVLPSKLATQAPRQLDVVILGFFGDPKALGIYFLASRIARLSSFGLQAAHLVVSPRFAVVMERARASGDSDLTNPSNRGKMQNTMRRGLIGMLWLSLPTIVVVALAAPTALGWAGAEYAQTGQVLVVIFLVGEAANVLCGPNGAFLNMTGLEGKLARISLAFLMVHVFCVALGAYLAGSIGAAVATTLALSTRSLTVSYAAWKHRRINTTVTALLFTGSSHD